MGGVLTEISIAFVLSGIGIELYLSGICVAPFLSLFLRLALRPSLPRCQRPCLRLFIRPFIRQSRLFLRLFSTMVPPLVPTHFFELFHRILLAFTSARAFCLRASCQTIFFLLALQTAFLCLTLSHQATSLGLLLNISDALCLMASMYGM
jgi:hypothetical protein